MPVQPNMSYDIVINGANVAHRFYEARNPGFKGFDWKGIKIALDHFIRQGVNPVAVVKDTTLRHCKFEESYRRKYVIGVPSRDDMKDGDDLFSLRVAMENNCYVLDNDNYRDWTARLQNKDPRLEEWFNRTRETFHISYTFAGNGQFFPESSELLPRDRRPSPARPVTAPTKAPSSDDFTIDLTEDIKSEQHSPLSSSRSASPIDNRINKRDRFARQKSGRSNGGRPYKTRSRSPSGGRMPYRQPSPLVGRVGRSNSNERNGMTRSRSRSPRVGLRHRRGCSPGRPGRIYRPPVLRNMDGTSPILSGAPGAAPAPAPPPALPPSCMPGAKVSHQKSLPHPFPHQVGDSDLCTLRNLNSAEFARYNGQLAKVETKVEFSDRWTVSLVSDKTVQFSVKPECIGPHKPKDVSHMVAVAPNTASSSHGFPVTPPIPAPHLWQHMVQPPPMRQAYQPPMRQPPPQVPRSVPPPPPMRKAHPPEQPRTTSKKAVRNNDRKKEQGHWVPPRTHCKTCAETEQDKQIQIANQHRVWTPVDPNLEPWRGEIPKADMTVRAALSKIGYNCKKLAYAHRVHVCGGLECVRDPQVKFAQFGQNSGRVSVGCLRCDRWTDWYEQQKLHPPICPCNDDESEEDEVNTWREWMEWPEGVFPDPPFSEITRLLQSLEAKGYSIHHQDVEAVFRDRNLDLVKHGNKNAKQTYWWICCRKCRQWRKCHWD